MTRTDDTRTEIVEAAEGRERRMLIFVSDIHLTDSLKGAGVDRGAMFERFWARIEASRGARPAHLCFVGDVFDIVRSPRWLTAAPKPYHEAEAAQAAVVDAICASILEREEPFFRGIRARVQSGALTISYVLGNHDRLLAHAPAARRRIWAALTGRDEDVVFPREIAFPHHGVLAYHGHIGDPICSMPEGGAPIGDAIGLDLIVRFPRVTRAALGATEGQHEVGGFSLEELEDIDDVRPIYAVPAWVRQLASRNRDVIKPMWESWQQVVGDFLAIGFVDEWMREQRRGFRFDAGRKLKLLLELSCGRIMAKTHDRRLTQLYRLFQHGFDGKLVETGIGRLDAGDAPGARYVVNGHSHFPSMVPLGTRNGTPSVYFNTGTWRTVHQIANHLEGRPSFLAYDAMSYLVFFPDGDRIGRDYEWWTGALVTRAQSGDHQGAPEASPSKASGPAD